MTEPIDEDDAREQFPGTKEAEEKYKEYCQSESNEAYSSILKNQEEYDKQLLTLSTGLLAVLVAFLKDIVHLDDAIILPVLYGCFASLGLTICAVLASFQVSNHALDTVRDYWKNQYDGKYSYQFPEKGGFWVKAVNITGGILFALGVLLGIVFIIVNVAHQTGMGKPK